MMQGAEGITACFTLDEVEAPCGETFFEQELKKMPGRKSIINRLNSLNIMDFFILALKVQN